MNIMIISNSPMSNSGYGKPTRYLIDIFKKMGHTVSLLPYDMHVPGIMNMFGCVVYPTFHDRFGGDIAGLHVKKSHSDVVLFIGDVWPLNPDYAENLGVPMISWFPVDTDPVSDRTARSSMMSRFKCTYSQFGERQMTGLGINTRYIPIGVDTNIFKPGDKKQARSILKWPEDKFICSMVAANMEYPSRKAFSENIEAYAKLAGNHKNTMLYLHTNFDERPSGLVDNVDIPAMLHMLGIANLSSVIDQYSKINGISDQYMALVYQASDVLLSASMGEGFGIPIIESQACGTPVITTNSTSMPELTMHGIVTEPCQRFWHASKSWQYVPSVNNIHEALENIYNWSTEKDETFIKSSVSGVEFVQKNFSWEVCEERYWIPFIRTVEQCVNLEKDIANENNVGG